MNLNRRATQRNTIQRAEKFSLSDAMASVTMIELEERARLLNAAYERFQEEHMSVVEAVEPGDMAVQHTFANETEAMYEQTLFRLMNRLHELNDERASAAPVAEERELSPGRAGAAEVRLERIKPMKFTGDYSTWCEWKSMYESLVHNNESLSEIQKFHYLKQSIEGSAANVISGWHTIAENYLPAYESLVKVFDNNYRIIMAHLDELMAVPRQECESHDGLRCLIDTINRVVRQLKVIGCPVEYWDDLIAHLLLTRMASATLEEWENSHDLTEMPTMESVVKFLERRARGKLNASCANVILQQVADSSSRTSGAKPKTKSNGAAANTVSVKVMKCNSCGQQHPMFRCAQFLKMSIEERRNKVRELKLCYNCLSPGHRANTTSCRFGPCQRCDKNQHHNSLLCLDATSASAVNTVTAGDSWEEEPESTTSKQNF